MNANLGFPILAAAQPDWICLLPAIVAIGLSVVLRSVLPALLLAVWCGVFLLQPEQSPVPNRVGLSFLQTVTETLPRQIAPPDGDTGHVEIVLFTLFLGCTIGVMQTSGGTAALVARLTPLTRSRRGGQLTTWLLGMVIFFDDYANSLLVGSTMRPVTDRLRISREKLAFLVDATAAPISGLAIVSTWVGFEVTQIGDTFDQLAKEYTHLPIATDGYSTLLATLPYRFYPILIILFVGLLAWTGRDFGSMWHAERRTLKGPPASSAEADAAAAVSTWGEPGARRDSMWNAIVPLGVLFAALVAGLWWTGMRGTDAPDPTIWQIVSDAESNKVMLASSFIASVCAVLMAVATRSLSFLRAIDAWLEGAKSMLLGCAVLILAWAIAEVCDDQHLDTAAYLVDVTRGWLTATWLPAVTFVLSGAIAFATGSSWATMGLVIPLVINVTFQLILDEAPALSDGVPLDRHPLMLASIGGVLAGSIFGDHCSPISDTTVLSSIASDCDHLAHVATQMPYAVTVGLIATVCGCLPAGFGVSCWISLPAGLVLCLLVVRYMGRPQAAE
jgi:Na+/H+ antiporter NhaC